MSGTRRAGPEQLSGTAAAVASAEAVALDSALAAVVRDPGGGNVGAALIAALAARDLPIAALDSGVDFLVSRLLAGDLHRAREGLMALLDLVADYDWPVAAAPPALIPGRLLLAGPNGAAAAVLLLEALGRADETTEQAAGVSGDPALLAVWAWGQRGDWAAAAAWARRTGDAAGDPALLAEIAALAELALSGDGWRGASDVLEKLSPAGKADRLRLLLAEAAVRHRDVAAALSHLEVVAQSAEADGRLRRAVEVRRLMAELAPEG